MQESNHDQQLLEQVRQCLHRYISEHWKIDPRGEWPLSDDLAGDPAALYPVYFGWIYSPDQFQRYGTEIELRAYLVYSVHVLSHMCKLEKYNRDHNFRSLYDALNAECDITRIRVIFRSADNPDTVTDEELEEFFMGIVREAAANL